MDGSPQSALWWISSLRENYAIIFDNADNLTPEELEQYFPSGLEGNILITSCNSGLKHLTLHESSLEVKEMEENDAISLLLKAACLDECQEHLQVEASKIVNELFCIPLAIDQVGAFIAFGDTDILMNILKIKKDYYLTQLTKGHLNITELCVGLGSYHLKRFNKELQVMTLKELRQLRVQCYLWQCLPSFILRVFLKKFFLMLLLRHMKIMSRGLLCLLQAP